jgi:NAD(P)-dependent dehydrogenase (short-subunit alcohol dehydrogenase family)
MTGATDPGALRHGRLAGRVAIVTGAGRGLGRAFAESIAGEEGRVIVVDRDGTAAEEVATAISAGGGEAVAIRVDIADAADTERMAATTIERFGRIDVLVNNAAAMAELPRRPFDEIPQDEFGRVLAVNVIGTWLCTRAVIAQMRRQAYGKIVNVASDMVLSGAPGLLHYVASKGAIVAMTRSLAREVGDANVTVNTIAPGFTLTEGALVHGGGVAETRIRGRAIQRAEIPDDVTGTLLYLASADSDFVTGQLIAVNGGYVLS